MRKLAVLFIVFLSFSFSFSTLAYADTVDDYNRKVADAKLKIADLQNQLLAAQNDLDSWLNNGGEQSNLINDAQSAVMVAGDALDSAALSYTHEKNVYDALFADNAVAEGLVSEAVDKVNRAADLVDSSYAVYDNSQVNSDLAEFELNNAKNDYDTKLINVGGQSFASGLLVDVYTGINKTNNPPSRSDVVYTKCKTVTVSNIDANWGSGAIFGCASDYVMLHYRGYITYPTTTKVYFQAPADDGFYLSIGGQTVINDWSLKGCGANSTGMFSFTGGKSYAVDGWFYEWTGGACSTLNYKPLGLNTFSVVPGSMFSQNAVAEWVKDPALKVILDSKLDVYLKAVALEEKANKDYLSAVDSYDASSAYLISVENNLSLKRSLLKQQDFVLQSVEDKWQNASDRKAVCDAALRDLKLEYASIFDAIDKATLKVDALEKDLEQAKLDLENIPKPSAADKRVPKKVVAKYFADAAYVPRGGFVPNPK